jgi:hypothetical protein
MKGPGRAEFDFSVMCVSVGHPRPIQAKQDGREKKYEEICRVANHDFRVRRSGSSKDQLLPHLRTLSHLH